MLYICLSNSIVHLSPYMFDIYLTLLYISLHTFYISVYLSLLYISLHTCYISVYLYCTSLSIHVIYLSIYLYCTSLSSYYLWQTYQTVWKQTVGNETVWEGYICTDTILTMTLTVQCPKCQPQAMTRSLTGCWCILGISAREEIIISLLGCSGWTAGHQKILTILLLFRFKQTAYRSATISKSTFYAELWKTDLNRYLQNSNIQISFVTCRTPMYRSPSLPDSCSTPVHSPYRIQPLLFLLHCKAMVCSSFKLPEQFRQGGWGCLST